MEFLILGPLEVRNGEDTVRLGAAKPRALLGVLLLHANETVSTSRLVDALWGEAPPATAEKLVQGYVHALRKQLGEGVLETRPPGYRLNLDSRSLDLLEFERLTDDAHMAPLPQSVEVRRRALALWRGSPLADVPLEGSERYTLSRLGELRLATQIEQIDAELALGRHTKLVGELESLIAQHPYQERLHAQLMLALYRSGRQAEALEAYRGLRRRLDDELGLQPGQELRELETAILRQDPEISGPAGTAAPSVLEQSIPTDTTVAIPSAPARRTRRRTLLGAGAALGLGAFAALIAAVLLPDGATPITVAPNHVAVIDADTNRVTSTIQVGIRPGPVAAGARAIWVGNLDDRSLTRIDPSTGDVVKTIPLPATPDAIAVGARAVWVVNGRLGTLYRIDPEFETVSDPIELGTRSISFTRGGVDVGAGWVWAALGDSTLARVDPTTLRSVSTSARMGPVAVVVAFGSVWVANSGDAFVQRFSPSTFGEGPLKEITVGSTPSGMAAGAGALWVASETGDYVTRLDASIAFNSRLPIPVENRPTAVAFGAGAVWVANTGSGTLSRIDPVTNEVERIEVGNSPAGIAVSGDRVWAAVQAP